MKNEVQGTNCGLQRVLQGTEIHRFNNTMKEVVKQHLIKKPLI